MNAADVQAFFAQVANDWDSMRLGYYDERVIDAMATAARLTADMTVADVGTGTGFVAAGLAGRVRRVFGIDNSAEMLAQATRNFEALGIDNVTLMEADSAGLPLETDSVDAAVANMVLHHAEEPAKMLGEMTRIVKPDGTVVIVDEVEHTYGWMREEQADVWLGFGRDQVEGLFQHAGLADIGYETLAMQ